VVDIATAFAGIVTVELAVAVLVLAHATLGLPTSVRPWVTSCATEERTGLRGLAAGAPVGVAAVVGAFSFWCLRVDGSWAWGVVTSLVMLFLGVWGEPWIHERLVREKANEPPARDVGRGHRDDADA